ncbi:MAG: protein adenylyltransferase SelO [Chitinophagaceae bacterium]
MNPFNFNNTYLSLPSAFYSLVKPSTLNQAEMVLINYKLAQTLDINLENKKALEEVLFGNDEEVNNHSFAQAYAGHQFGGFTMLGDGRAIVLGEHVDVNKNRFDIQLKGGGRTPYSRGGDGKATLKAMLREYLMSESMHYLGIPTSRSLAVVSTGETVFRETAHQGAFVARIMKSHIRIGTFEFASYLAEKDNLKALLDYTINRLYPHLITNNNKALAFLDTVIAKQLSLVALWMRVGFIHGVMNTDNIAITGETFDYGPCAFMNAYDPNTVFSSIDTGGRYAFGNQPNIIKWNLIKLAQALLPMVDEDQKTAVTLVQKAFENFDNTWFDVYYNAMLNKLGIENKTIQDRFLVDELLQIMHQLQLDYTNTFLSLSSEIEGVTNFSNDKIFITWKERWLQRVADNSNGLETAKAIMQQNNPVFIPRNDKVEQALEAACNGDFGSYNLLLDVISKPYSYNKNYDSFLAAPNKNFETSYKTFCGT